MILSFLKRHKSNGRIKASINSLPPSLAPISDHKAGTVPAPPRFDPVKWARNNPWLVEGHPDDRLPVNGAVSASGRTPAEQRSFARSSHQARFKKWSQARHD